MKKFALVLVIFLTVTGATLFAQSAESILAAIPSASYNHPSDGTVWVFAATGIEVQEKGVTVASIPTSGMKDLAAARDGLQAGFSFSSDVYERKYRFTINAANGNVTRTIDRAGLAQDVVVLTRR